MVHEVAKSATGQGINKYRLGGRYAEKTETQKKKRRRKRDLVSQLRTEIVFERKVNGMAGGGTKLVTPVSKFREALGDTEAQSFPKPGFSGESYHRSLIRLLAKRLWEGPMESRGTRLSIPSMSFLLAH